MSAGFDPRQIVAQELDVARRRALREAYAQIPALVLEDLANYIHPDEPTFVADDLTGRRSAFAEGLRAVWIHIQKRRSQPDTLAPVITKETP